MKWKKLGKVYSPSGDKWWAKSHAYVPTPIVLDKRIRVFFASRDEDNVGRVGFLDLNPNNPLEILKISPEPVLDIGRPGTFDDNGVTPTSVVRYKEKFYMFYFGWQVGAKVRYLLFSGLAESENSNDFTRRVEVPILDRAPGEVFVRSAPTVIVENGVFKLWYVSGNKWIDVKEKKVPTYGIRFLEQEDLLNCDKEGHLCLEPNGNDEYGFGRPYVLREHGIYKMWYSIRTRSKGYRLGYAESDDGLNWIRKDDEVGIDVSESDWDSEMICMSSIIDVNNERYMFYNGNNYGETGFGVAKLEED